MRFRNFIALCASTLVFAVFGMGQQTAPTQVPPPSVAQPGQLNGTVSAPPFTVSDKFDYRVVQAFGLRGFAGSGASALVGQLFTIPYAWGGGIEGFSKRFGSSFGGNVSRQVFATTLEVAFKEDPRYFPSEDKDLRVRLLNVVKQVVLTKTDSNGDSLAYARVISAFGAAEVVNVWQPKGNNDQREAMNRALITLGADAGYNFLQEFFPFTRPISLRHRH